MALELQLQIGELGGSGKRFNEHVKNFSSALTSLLDATESVKFLII